MTTEEILTVLEELAKNTGLVLFDWDDDELGQLLDVARRLVATVSEVLSDSGDEEGTA